MIDRTAQRDVADTIYACREWFEGYKVAYTGADVVAMASLVLKREREYGDAASAGNGSASKASGTSRMPDDADRLAYARALVRCRCPELTDADLAALGELDMPVLIAEAVCDALAEVETRLDQLALDHGLVVGIARETLRQRLYVTRVLGEVQVEA